MKKGSSKAIDTSDAPEQPGWSGAKRGLIRQIGKRAELGELSARQSPVLSADQTAIDAPA